MDAQVGFADALHRVFPTALAIYLLFRGGIRQGILCEPSSVTFDMRQCVGSLVRKPGAFDYAEVRDLAEPKVPEAPLLTLSGQPDLKIYDRLLTGGLAAVEVCG